MKPAGKILVFAIVLVGAAFGAYKYFGWNILPEKAATPSSVPPKADLPSLPGGSLGTSGGAVIPSSNPTGGGRQIRFLIWAWSSQLGGLFANGGAQTTEGSLMAKNGVNVHFVRQDDVAKMQEELVTFADRLSKGEKHPTEGAHFVAIMGDGAASFLAGINPTLRRLGPGYVARVVGSMGYSRGEDKFMGPPEWKRNPAASKGGVVAGYLRDGDWNIAMKWLADNGLKNNPDEKTWDPDALNWVAANDYIDAAEKYVAGYTETRPVVRNGRRTGETKRITVQGSVTWTPGDVTIAKKRGGIVSIVSTKEYSSQMPNAIIGIDKWMKENRTTVERMLDAIFRGGDALKAGPGSPAFDHACQIAEEVFAEEGADAAYWAKYFPGVVEKDAKGLDVELGGSYVNNLADNMILFGLVPGSNNLFKATYEVFGDIVRDQYPDLVPSYPPISEALDSSYVASLSKRSGPTSGAIAAAKPQPATGTARPTTVVSRRSWRIQFATGKANFTAAASSQLNKLLKDLLVAQDTVVEIHGHTDSVGSPQANLALSEARAFAVKTWLEKKAPVNFPKGRLRVYSHGQQNPVAPNSSEAGRAQNRRVDIVIGTR